ncbi:MAG: hypothetical protein HY667_05365 [Chloroflexi bacterium]|nr:hypothetical protein [Chloroflexota bacterium]
MKSTATLVVLAAILIAGCTSVPSGPAPSPSAMPEPVTSPSPATLPQLPPAARPPATSTTPEQTPTPALPERGKATANFVWSNDPGIRLEGGNVPYVHRLQDGRIRMYYGDMGGIASAISSDGLTFDKEPGVRVISGNAGGPETIVNDPTVVRLKDGRVRMYYKGATGPGGPDRSTHTIYSAVSTDGLSFEKEGVRIDPHQTTDRGWASVPEAVVLPDGRVRLYYVSDALDVGHGIVSAISDDGLSFSREGPVLSGFVDPAVVRLSDGTYLMLGVAFPQSGAAPGIYSFTSQDGLSFSNHSLVLAGQNDIDPAIIGLGNGNYRVYYWSMTDQPPTIKSISGKLSTAPASATRAPDISSVQAPRNIAGAKVWLFAVDDGNPRLALSAESDGQLLVGRLDISNPTAPVSWRTVAGPADTGGAPIADHWHIYAHGYHWLVFSVAGDNASYLLKLSKDFQRIALVPVGHADGPTNDMFLVAEPGGVAVGHFAPTSRGQIIHRFNVGARKIGEASIGGGAFAHTNGSSAIPVEGGYLLFATETLNPSVAGAVRMIQLDASWRPVSSKAVLDETGTNAAMPTAVRLANGYMIVNLRVRTGVSPRGAAPGPLPQPGGLLPDDSGALVRLVLTPDGTVVNRETLAPAGTNRPHTALVGDLLVTTWDETGTVRLRVERVQ